MEVFHKQPMSTTPTLLPQVVSALVESNKPYMRNPVMTTQASKNADMLPNQKENRLLCLKNDKQKVYISLQNLKMNKVHDFQIQRNPKSV